MLTIAGTFPSIGEFDMTRQKIYDFGTGSLPTVSYTNAYTAVN